MSTPASEESRQAAAIDLDSPLDGLVYEKRGHAAIVVLNRPESANALSRAMRPALRAIWHDVMQDRKLRSVIVTGAGRRHFSTGTDVNDVAATGTTTSDAGPLSETLVWSPLMMGVWKPVICAVNGLVAGGGLHFVVDADIVLAAEHAQFMDTHTSVGMVGGVENVALAHRLTAGSALRMTFSGRHYRMSATRAHQLGLVDEVVPGEDLLDTALEIAAQIATNSPAAIMRSKQAIWHSFGRPLADAMEHGWELARAHWDHPDFREGPRAFAEGRPPEWADP